MALAQKLDKTKKTVVTGRKARRKLEKLAKKEGAGKAGGDGKAALIESLWRKGSQLVREERFDAAEKVFREILSHLPDHARGHYILAQLVDRRLGATAAYPLFVRAAALDAGDGLHFDGLARCLMQMSVFEAAVVAFSKAIALDPVRADLYVQWPEPIRDRRSSIRGQGVPKGGRARPRPDHRSFRDGQPVRGAGRLRCGQSLLRQGAGGRPRLF